MADLRHIHTDPFRDEGLREALGDETFDVCVATYGRLRVIARVMAGAAAASSRWAAARSTAAT